VDGKHLFDACRDESIAAGAGAALVGAGLQRHISGSTDNAAALFCGITQSHDFGMWTTGTLGVTLAEGFAVWAGDDAAYAGVGRGQQQAFRGLRQGLFKKDSGVRHKGFGAGVCNF
jgi:hypothetical protein